MTRVLLLNNVPSPNLKPLFDLLGRKSGWDLTVCYVCAWHRNVGWTPEKIDNGGPHRTIILDQKMPRLAGILGVRPAAALALAHILRRERPDYLICYGYTLMPQITAILWSIFTNTPFAISGDANIYCDSARSLSLSKQYIKRWWLGEVVRCAAALLTVGTASRMFWESYGARPEKLFESRFAVDNDFYARSTAARKAESMALREKLGLTNKVVFLFVGRLIKRKNVDLIIRALSRLKDDPIALVIAGDGEEYDSLAALAGDDRRVIFMGSVAPCSLPLCYAMADVLVLPARDEPWGLVINEAMASGLAIISHRHCGATLDLVRNDNGLVLKTFSVSELAVAMKLLASDGRLRRSMQKRSQEKIRLWTIDDAAQAIIQAVRKTEERRQKSEDRRQKSEVRSQKIE